MTSIPSFFTDKNGNLDFGNLVDLIRNVEDRLSSSLTKSVKSSMISSRVFIMRSCAEETILPALLQSIHSLYVSLVFAAIGCSQQVDNARTVRDIMSIVATEGFNKPYIDQPTLLSGLEHFDGIVKPRMDALTIKDDPRVDKTTGASIIDPTVKDLSLVTGRIVEMEFHAGGDAKNKFKIQMLVQLFPTFIHDTVMREFFALNFEPSTLMRFFKVTTGEISFIKDFLFEMDRLRDRNEALRRDKTGDFKDMLDRQRSLLTTYFLKLAGYQKERQNIANTVQIFNKTSFDAFCRNANCDFKRSDHRNKYMNKTMSMIVAVIDSDYNKVDLYYSGIDHRAEYNFDQIENLAKNKQYDLGQVMKAFSNTSAPKF